MTDNPGDDPYRKLLDKHSRDAMKVYYSNQGLDDAEIDQRLRELDQKHEEKRGETRSQTVLRLAQQKSDIDAEKQWLKKNKNHTPADLERYRKKHAARVERRQEKNRNNSSEHALEQKSIVERDYAKRRREAAYKWKKNNPNATPADVQAHMEKWEQKQGVTPQEKIQQKYRKSNEWKFKKKNEGATHDDWEKHRKTWDENYPQPNPSYQEQGSSANPGLFTDDWAAAGIDSSGYGREEDESVPLFPSSSSTVGRSMPGPGMTGPGSAQYQPWLTVPQQQQYSPPAISPQPGAAGKADNTDERLAQARAEREQHWADRRGQGRGRGRGGQGHQDPNQGLGF